MNLNYIFPFLFFCTFYRLDVINSERVTFINVERPIVYFYDKKYCKNLTLISRRISRQDPKHYFELYIHTLYPATDNLMVHLYFYQLLTNGYQPSFVEMHLKFCDMVESDAFFGVALRAVFGNRRCPFPPGEYDLRNMTIPYVPKGFPFNKGRIYCNVTLTDGGVVKHVGRASVDMEVKVSNIDKKKKTSN